MRLELRAGNLARVRSLVCPNWGTRSIPGHIPLRCRVRRLEAGPIRWADGRCSSPAGVFSSPSMSPYATLQNVGGGRVAAGRREFVQMAGSEQRQFEVWHRGPRHDREMKRRRRHEPHASCGPGARSRMSLISDERTFQIHYLCLTEYYTSSAAYDRLSWSTYFIEAISRKYRLRANSVQFTIIPSTFSRYTNT